MKQKLSAILSSEKRSAIFDTVRTVLLTLFTLFYAVAAVNLWFELESLLTDWFPTLTYRASVYLSIAVLAVIAAVLILLLVRSFEHFKNGLHLQVLISLCVILPYVVLTVVNNSDGWEFLALVLLGIAFGSVLAVQAVVLLIREAVRKKIGDRKKERLLGWGLFGAFILVLLLIFLILPSYRQVGKELNEVLQNPGEGYRVDNYQEDELTALIPEEAWAEILPTLEVDPSDKDRERWGYLELSVEIYTAEHPDREIRLLWWKRDECVQIYYRGTWYYADDSAFKAKLAEYLPLDQPD